MHIAFLTPEYPHPDFNRSGGLGTSIKNLATSLVEAGEIVTVFVYSQVQDKQFEDQGIHIHSIAKRNYKFAGWYLYRKFLQRYINKYVLLEPIDFIEAPDWTGITALMRFKCQLVIRCNGSDGYFCHLDNRKQKLKNRYLYKSPFADVTMGLNTNLNYKNWDLAIVTRASLGNYAYNNMASSKSYEVRATENSILTNLHRDYFNTGFQSITETSLQSDYYIQDASFFKLDNITLGYTFAEVFKDSDLRLYGSAQNVLILTDYDGLDPEINGGIDNNFYPRPRVFTFGVNLNF